MITVAYESSIEHDEVIYINRNRTSGLAGSTLQGLGPIDIHAIQIMAAARCTKP